MITSAQLRKMGRDPDGKPVAAPPPRKPRGQGEASLRKAAIAKRLPEVLALLRVERLPDGIEVGPLPKKCNGLEAKYGAKLILMERMRIIDFWMLAPIRLLLAHKTTYAPDFVFRKGATICCIEIKGFLRDDAAVKFKFARERFPWMDFKMLKFVKGEWVEIMQHRIVKLGQGDVEIVRRV